jgi:predicted nucleic acid-binding protein
MIVVDASALLEMLLCTSLADRVTERLFDPGQSLHAPHLIDLEVAQVLRRSCAAGKMSEQRAEEALDDLGLLRLMRHPHSLYIKRVWELRNNFTAYDAAYVALAEALAAPLITCDHALAQSRLHRAIIELL